MKTLLHQADQVTRRDVMARTAQACFGVGMLSALYGGDRAMAIKYARSGIHPTAFGSAKQVIYLYLSGGMSHLDTLDPKPGAPTQGEFSPIRSAAPGVLLGEHLPRLAGMMDKATLIRSMTSSQGAHERGRYLMHTSYAPLGTVQHPGIGSWITKLAGRMNPRLPGMVMVGGNGLPGAAFLGSEVEPLRIGRPDAGLQNSKLHDGLTESEFDKRRRLMDRLDQSFRSRFAKQHTVGAYTRFYDEAVTMMKSQDLKAFDLGGEPREIKQAYGSTRFGQGCLLARRLVEHGVRFVEVNMGGWDTHQDNFEKLSENLLPELDRALGSLINDLAMRGMLDETLVVLTSEFGRTPRINSRAGRDHYPKVFTSLLAGGGVKAGYVHGASTHDGTSVKDNPVTPNDLNATIAHALGVDHNKALISNIGRPFNLANGGAPVMDVFA